MATITLIAGLGTDGASRELLAADNGDGTYSLSVTGTDSAAVLAALAAILAKQPTSPSLETGHLATIDTSTAALAALIATGALKVVEQNATTAEDNVAGRLLVEQRNASANITTATTTVVKSGAGFLHMIAVNLAIATGTITIFDNTAGSGTTLATVTFPAAGFLVAQVTLEFDITFAVGLTIVTVGAHDLTVAYR